MSQTTPAALAGLELDVDTPSRVNIIHPTTLEPLCDKSGKQAYVEVISGDSATAEKIEKALRLRRMRQRNPDKIDLDAEHVETLAGLTTGWYLVDLSGNPIDFAFSADNAKLLYGNRRMKWLTDQVDRGAGDRANFLKTSSAS